MSTWQSVSPWAAATRSAPAVTSVAEAPTAIIDSPNRRASDSVERAVSASTRLGRARSASGSVGGPVPETARRARSGNRLHRRRGAGVRSVTVRRLRTPLRAASGDEPGPR